MSVRTGVGSPRGPRLFRGADRCERCGRSRRSGPAMLWLGLPQEAAVAFLFGFFRRDYGAAGLYDMRSILSPAQLVVAITTMTLFIPCVAQLAVTIKERGLKTALGIAAFILPFALLVGSGLNLVLKVLGVK